MSIPDEEFLPTDPDDDNWSSELPAMPETAIALQAPKTNSTFPANFSSLRRPRKPRGEMNQPDTQNLVEHENLSGPVYVRKLVFAEVYRSRVHRFLSERVTLQDVGSEDNVLAFEVGLLQETRPVFPGTSTTAGSIVPFPSVVSASAAQGTLLPEVLSTADLHEHSRMLVVVAQRRVVTFAASLRRE